ncbi:MAG: argininosuccinate lyase [Leptolinea sp.]|nr:argininosuccinate lyase [Leptolinea sp.]
MTLWSGRFRAGLDSLASILNNSLPVDKRLYPEDIRGSQAWAQALAAAGVLTADEAGSLVDGLQAVFEEMESGSFEFHDNDEDIHTAVERRLTELVGPVGGKLHTGRSRNDQVATDFRLWLLSTSKKLDAAIANLQKALIHRAEIDLEVILPGYTHFQQAQPILLSHWWMSHFWALQRDRDRLQDLTRRAAVLPLGSAALAGTTFPIDRFALSKDLGFNLPSQNSLDATSDRDFAAEFLFWASLTGVHLSRMAEALILYSTIEYGFVTMADEYSTGSSLMPQKKNPDMLELTRGKAGTLIGLLTGLLTTLKGLPSAYDKDLQEDKTAVFEAADTMEVLLPVVEGVISTLTVNTDRCRQAIHPAVLATDLADYLVARGVPFRSAHEAVGKAVRLAEETGKNLTTLTLNEYQSIHPDFTEDLFNSLNPESSVNRRSVYGGTAKQAVEKQIEEAKQVLH